jgi:hypothetical protein
LPLARVELDIEVIKLYSSENKVLLTSIKEYYRDIILFMAINMEVEGNILRGVLMALAVKALNCN